MKKLLASIVSFSLLLTLSACGNKKTETAPKTDSKTAGENSSAESTVSENGTSSGAETKDGKSLVVYFSWSGNTEKVAKSVASKTGSDVFEIIPKTPYSSDYNTVVSDAKAEQQRGDRPEFNGTLNLDQYDTVYVGFPNWWGDMPMIMYTFFDTYDLSGKTVAVFCTSGGSGLSNTVNEIKKLEPGATVTEGLHIRDNAANSPDDAVSKWLEKIS